MVVQGLKVSAVETGADLVAGVDLALARRERWDFGEFGQRQDRTGHGAARLPKTRTQISGGSVRIGDADVLTMDPMTGVCGGEARLASCHRTRRVR